MIGRYYFHCDGNFLDAISVSWYIVSYNRNRILQQDKKLFNIFTPRKIVTKQNCVDKILSDPMAMANDWRARSEAWFMGRLRETSVSYVCMYMHARMQVLLPIGIHEGKLSQKAIPLHVVASLPRQGFLRNIAAMRYIRCVESIDGRISRSIVIGRTGYVDSI